MTHPQQQAILNAAGIHKRFGALVVLDNIDFAMAANEAVGIVGPNGAGKTTLLSVLSGAFPPSAGTVAFKGGDVTALPATQRCHVAALEGHRTGARRKGA